MRPRSDGVHTNVQSVARAFAVLDVLEGQGAATTLEIARVTGLNRTVVHRLLRTLEQRGAVLSAGATHTLGPRLLTLGNAYLDHLTIRRVALPYAIDLRETVIRDNPWSVAVAVPVGDKMVVIDRLWGRATPLASILDVGTRFTSARTAGGRALLSACRPEAATAIVGGEEYQRLADDLARVRDAGVAFDLGAVYPGIGAVAAPIIGGDGSPVASLLIAGTEIEPMLVADSVLASAVVRFAGGISRSIAPSRDASTSSPAWS